MAELRVKYSVEVEQDLYLPDDEIEYLNYENLLHYLDIDKSHEIQYEDILQVTKNGREFNF